MGYLLGLPDKRCLNCAPRSTELKELLVGECAIKPDDSSACVTEAELLQLVAKANQKRRVEAFEGEPFVRCCGDGLMAALEKFGTSEMSSHKIVD